jgi:bifunctional NMN adenylyltransferase/nudix hydrolase
MRYPTAYPTVDIAVVRQHNGKDQVILGRKKGDEKWCFPGGFVEPKDESLEIAALRELSEEVTGIEVNSMIYIGSSKIRDERYEGTVDGIMTSVFLTVWEDGEPVAGDDLDEVRWFNTSEVKDHIIEKHKVILKILEY